MRAWRKQLSEVLVRDVFFFFFCYGLPSGLLLLHWSTCGYRARYRWECSLSWTLVQNCSLPPKKFHQLFTSFHTVLSPATGKGKVRGRCNMRGSGKYGPLIDYGQTTARTHTHSHWLGGRLGGSLIRARSRFCFPSINNFTPPERV